MTGAAPTSATVVGTAAALLLAGSALAAPLADLAALNPRLLDARDPVALSRLAAMADDALLYTAADGSWLDRAAFLARAAQRPPAARAQTLQHELRPFGTVVLVHGLTRGADAAAPERLVRHTDVWHWSNGRWRWVSAQDSLLRDGVPTERQTTTAPAAAAWTGPHPQGTEHQVLTALNDRYVQSFRESDIAWYDAHLSPDYVVVSGDGSMQDRGAALANFARPSFQTHMQSFPVGRVQIRRVADLALIHAENDYRLKDGRRGISRYTDIWLQQPDGRWSCIAAHITVHRAPSAD